MSDDWDKQLVNRIVSGGQTGVDRAALDVAIALNIPHGGWCPRGRLAEDGFISQDYQLCETESADYPIRTERNVTDSDATLILYRDRLFGGTELTRRYAIKHRKPHLAVDLSASQLPEEVARWIDEHSIRVLNVAGPRESSAPGIGEQARRWLTEVFSTKRHNRAIAPDRTRK